jgi:hypothetical protein
MCKWYEFHNWKPVKTKATTEFLESSCTLIGDADFRVCTKCNLAQQRHWNWNGSQRYTNLNNCETSILFAKTEEKETYYLLTKDE